MVKRFILTWIKKSDAASKHFIAWPGLTFFGIALCTAKIEVCVDRFEVPPFGHRTKMVDLGICFTAQMIFMTQAVSAAVLKIYS